MKYIKHYLIFESDSTNHELPKYRVGVKIWFTSVEPNNDSFTGYWNIYHHNIKMEILSNVFSPDQTQILDNLKSDKYTFSGDDYDWCDEVDAVMNKANISKIASESQSVDDFIDKIQGEIYDATVDYYADLIGDEDEEEDDEDDNEEEDDEDDEEDESRFMNLDALSDITYGDDCQGVEYSSANPSVVISDDTISIITDEINGGDSLDHAINYALDEDWIDEKDIPVLLAHLKDPTRLDAYIKDNPMDLDLLDGLPDVKAGVLARTGLEDVSDLARAMRKGLI